MQQHLEEISLAVSLDSAGLAGELKSLSRLGESFGRSMTRAFAGAITGGRKFSDVLRSLALSLSRQALTSALKPVGNILGGAVGNIFSAIAGSSPTAAPIRPIAFADGGVVNSPSLFPLRGGSAVGLAGEAGPEAILPLARGSDGRLGVRAGDSAAINVVINVTTPDVAGFQRSSGQITANLARALERAGRHL